MAADPESVRAKMLAHHLRRQVLRLLASSSEPLSTKLMVAMLKEQGIDVSVPALAHHVRALRDQVPAPIVLTGTVPRRGAVESFYTLTAEGRELVETMARIAVRVDVRTQSGDMRSSEVVDLATGSVVINSLPDCGSVELVLLSDANQLS